MQILCLGKLPAPLKDQLQNLPGLTSLRFIERRESLSVPEMIAALKDIDIVLSEPQDRLQEEIIKASPALKMIAQRAVGYDNINLPECTKANILVTNTPGVLDNATADLAFSLLLATARRIVEADKYVRDGRWEGFESDLMLGSEISGKTLGIIGLGRIGLAVARRAHGFGLKIIYTRASDQIELDDKDRSLQDQFGARRVNLEQLYRESDFISVHCPLNAETTGLIDKKAFDTMKNGCIFVNTARGKVVEQQALVDAVISGKIKAGLDVFASEPDVPPALKSAPNVVLAPHIGSATDETRFKMAELAVTAVVKAASGECPPNSLNPKIFASFSDNLKAPGR